MKEGIRMTRGHYATHQQQEILRCLSECDGFVTVDAIYEQLLANGVKVGRATVYRFLERLETEGMVVKCKASDSSHTEYHYLEKQGNACCGSVHKSEGKLCCVECGSVTPLHCRQLEGLSRHILNEHGFILEPEKTVLYGRCQRCAKQHGGL
jgi:Fur family ferric uptake transcriptional regulator